MGIEALLQKRITTLRKERFQLDKQITKLELTQKQLNELKEDFDKPFSVTTIKSATEPVEGKYKKEINTKPGERKGRILKYLPLGEKNAVSTPQVSNATKFDGEVDGHKLDGRTQSLLNDLFKRGFVLKKRDPLSSSSRALVWWRKP